MYFPTPIYVNQITDINRNSTKSEQEQMNTKGYMRHSGMHNLGMIDSAGTEATLVSYVGGIAI